MIPDETDVTTVWNAYHLPAQKRIHCQLVCDVSRVIGSALRKKGIHSHTGLVEASALLHDIDKSVQKLPGERHPDAAVRLLQKEGMEEVASVVRTHPLHAILDPAIKPKTIEQKIVYLSDKMVKYAFIGVDERFRLWRGEEMGKEERDILEAAYPKVKELEKELLEKAGLTDQDIRLALESGT